MTDDQAREFMEMTTQQLLDDAAAASDSGGETFCRSELLGEVEDELFRIHGFTEEPSNPSGRRPMFTFWGTGTDKAPQETNDMRRAFSAIWNSKPQCRGRLCADTEAVECRLCQDR